MSTRVPSPLTRSRFATYHPVALKSMQRYAMVRWMRARTVVASALWFGAMEKASTMLRLQGIV